MHYQDFLRNFFAPPNKLTCQLIESSSKTDFDTIKTEAIHWLEAVSKKKDIPLLIPYLGVDNVLWFACCNDLSQLEQVKEELTSFLSGVYVSIAKPEKPGITDTVELMLYEYFDSLYVKLTPIPNKEKELHEIMSVYRGLLQRRPVRAVIGSRPEGRIRYDFEQALLTQNEQRADACIEEWKLTGRLSHQNLRFLIVRKLAALGRWSQIVHNPDYLLSIVGMRLPARIQADLFEAIYHVYLIKYEQISDFEGLKKEFQEKVKNKYGNLFKTRRGINLSNVIKLFLLYEITREEPDTSVCDELLREYDQDENGYEYFRRIVNEFKQISAKPGTDVIITNASGAFDDGDYDKALSLYLQCDINERVLVRILMCADFIGSMETSRRVWQVCLNNESLVAKIPERWRKFFEDLKGRFDLTFKPVSDWYSLIEFIYEGGDSEQALKMAESGVIEWSISTILFSPEKTKSFADLLISTCEKNQPLSQDIFPYLYEAFTADTRKEGKLLPVYRNLLFLIAYAETLSDDDLELAKNLSIIMMKHETKADEYRNTIDLLSQIWEKKQSIHYLDWGLDIVESFAMYPSADFNATVSFFNSILQLAAQKKSHVNEGQWIILEQLAEYYGSVEYITSFKPKQAPTEQEKNLSSFLEGKRIGIYTLEEPAGKRAKAVIEKLYTGVKVEINNDHEATSALINLAQTSDIFIFAWKSSKHQAFYCIQDNIKRKGNLIQSLGKGTTSILRSLEAFIMK